jgi:hypothetical protein
MGMFDRVFIDKNKLPLSVEQKLIIPDNMDWQTKDFDCDMTDIYITKEGKLKIKRWNYESVPKKEKPYPNDEGLPGLAGSLRRVNERLEPIFHHGNINFYSMVGDEWFEFNAKFSHGKLVGIVRDVTS